MRIIGLTGGIAAGKSTVAAMFARRGVPLVDADVIARDVVAPGTPGLDRVVAEFGREVLCEDGTLDRPRLGAKVFGDPARRAALNKILHPLIAAESARNFSQLPEGTTWAIYDAALIVENNLHETFAGLVVVTARADKRLARIVARDGLTPAEAEARMASQLAPSKKLSVATWVIDNSSTIERTEHRLAELYAEIVVAYGSPRALARSRKMASKEHAP